MFPMRLASKSCLHALWRDVLRRTHHVVGESLQRVWSGMFGVRKFRVDNWHHRRDGYRSNRARHGSYTLSILVRS